MLSSTTIYFNKKNEEVARITFDENDVPGWCIKSKTEPGFKRKFAAQREACAVWSGNLIPKRQAAREIHRRNCPTPIDRLGLGLTFESNVQSHASIG